MLVSIVMAASLGCSDSGGPTEPPSTTTVPPSSGGRFVAEQLLALPSFPTAMVFTSPNRLLYTEKGGFGGIRDASVRVVTDGILDPTPVIRFTDVETRAEMGLLGIALDPEYDTNRQVYVFYTHGSSSSNRVARFRDDGLGQGDADATIVLRDLPADRCGNHQGGSLGFGLDGMLYVSIGDNGCDACLSQDDSTLAGKLLRFTRDGGIPPDNPFADAAFPRSAFFVKGLRNSFDFAVHPESGEIVATENGPRENDEINHLVAGANYGWPVFQCDQDFGNDCPRPRPTQKGPLRCHQSVVAPTGVTFYEGSAYPADFRGSLFYGDFNTGTLRRLVLSGDADTLLTEDQRFLPGFGSIIDVVSGLDGRIYVLTDSDIQRVDFVEN